MEWAQINLAVSRLGALETTVCLEALTPNEIATCVPELVES